MDDTQKIYWLLIQLEIHPEWDTIRCMDIKFFDDPLQSPNSRDDVRIKQLGLFLFEDRRRVAVGFDITPFLERPSIQVSIRNLAGMEISSLHVIETLETNFSLTMHLRDPEPEDTYEVSATLYYATPDTERQNIQTITKILDATKPGEQ